MRPMRRLSTSTVWRKPDEEYVKNKHANHRVPFMPPFLCFGIIFNENLSSDEIKPDYMVYTTKEINGKNAKNSKWILAKYDESLTLKKMVSDVIDENMVGIVTKWINKEAKNLNLPPGRIFAIDVDRYGNKLRYYIQIGKIPDKVKLHPLSSLNAYRDDRFTQPNPYSNSKLKGQGNGHRKQILKANRRRERKKASIQSAERTQRRRQDRKEERSELC